MAAFGVLSAAVTAWLIFGGVAARARGLSFQNQTSQVMYLRFDDGRVTKLEPRAQQTLPVKPAQFPQTFTVTDASGKTLYQQRFDFPEFKDYGFQIGLEQDRFLLYKGIYSPGTY